jgi:quercetin dioxygenase-like cupin family protein
MIYREKGSARSRVSEGITRREAACGKGCQIIEFILEKGSVIPDHSHPNEQVGTVVRGSIVLKMNGKNIAIGAGDGYSIAPGEVHGVDVLEDSLVIDVFAPPREDYRDTGLKPAI